MKNVIGILLLSLLWLCAAAISEDEKSYRQRFGQSETKIKTRYGTDGRPVNQGVDVKSLHRVTGRSKLVNGVDTVTLNTSTIDGRLDVSFSSDSTYSGRVWTKNLGDRTKRFSLVPLSGVKFIVVSSDTTDTATVFFEVEGE